jgi:hypothetical protein
MTRNHRRWHAWGWLVLGPLLVGFIAGLLAPDIGGRAGTFRGTRRSPEGRPQPAAEGGPVSVRQVAVPGGRIEVSGLRGSIYLRSAGLLRDRLLAPVVPDVLDHVPAGFGTVAAGFRAALHVLVLGALLALGRAHVTSFDTRFTDGAGQRQ